MIAALFVVAGVLALIGSVTHLMIVVDAFHKDFIQGMLCVFIPLYAAYWALVRFKHPRRQVVLAALFVAPALALLTGGAAMFATVG